MKIIQKGCLLFFCLTLFFFVVSEQALAIDLEEQIGQLLVVGFRGTRLDDAPQIKTALQQNRLGGVILFNRDVLLGSNSRNISNPEQLKELIQSIRESCPGPVMVAVDQEGGRVARLNETNGFVRGPTHSELATFSACAVQQALEEQARQLEQMGINTNLAPVVDLCSNPDNPVIAGLGRCFSADPGQVTRLAHAYVQVHHRYQLVTALKHFPGHGSSLNDSHLGVTDVTDFWTAEELEPYRRLINDHYQDLIMVAHVYNRHLDPDYPASLSKATISGLLREQLGFKGVVISDDLQMGALSQQYVYRDILRLALNAGNDLLVIGNNLSYDVDIVEKTIQIIKNLIAANEVEQKTIDRAYERVVKLKSRLK